MTEYWPQKGAQIAQNGSDGVMNFVASSAGQGSIGVDEYSYALAQNYPVAKIENSAGYFTAPTQYNVAVALTQAQINLDQSSPDYLLESLTKVYTYNDPRTGVEKAGWQSINLGFLTPPSPRPTGRGSRTAISVRAARILQGDDRDLYRASSAVLGGGQPARTRIRLSAAGRCGAQRWGPGSGHARRARRRTARHRAAQRCATSIRSFAAVPGARGAGHGLRHHAAGERFRSARPLQRRRAR